MVFIMGNWDINIHVRITLISHEALFVSLYVLAKQTLLLNKLKNNREGVLLFVICNMNDDLSLALIYVKTYSLLFFIY